MDNLWNQKVVPPAGDTAASAVEQCAYGSRLLGSDPALVLHGGGNTSVKATTADVTGADVDVLYVKGSGHDLASIQPAGFVPLRLARLRELLDVDALTDSQMVNELRCALLDASAPNPSVEALLHALLPYGAAQHSHADVIVTLTNLADGESRIRDVFGSDVVVIPYSMPGFDLAKLCAKLWPEQAGANTKGMVLLNHGLFTFGDTTREAYENHVELITRAEDYLANHAPLTEARAVELPSVPIIELATMRQAISDAAGFPMVLTRHTNSTAANFVTRDDLRAIASRGPATPDHIIRTKQLPMIGRDVDAYVQAYRDYFQRNSDQGSTSLSMLDPAPRVVLDPEWGLLTAGRRGKDADIAYDIYAHTMPIIARGESLGGYTALPEEDLFAVEYWDLEQAKLRRGGAPPMFGGQVALVTGAASGIGKACAEALLAAGASVIGFDVTASVATAFDGPEWLGCRVDVTDETAVQIALQRGVERFGGMDMVIPCAGVFAASAAISELDTAAWRRTMSVNVDSVAALLRHVHPLLARAPRGGRVAVIASKNVPAPGPGAAAYSASKAALTQLARVAALEWAGDGIRVNIVHPDAVFDTGLWTPKLLAERANKYHMTVEQYKRRNLLHTEISSDTVASAVVRLCSAEFSATTGAQVPVDGGSDRVI